MGSGVGPVVADEPPRNTRTSTRRRHRGARRRGGGHTGHETPPAGGLQISEGGYTLDLRDPARHGRASRPTCASPSGTHDGRAVTAYQREHDKELHLIVASRDLVTYRHLHPTRAADGTWSTPVDLPRAGGYRVFADFTPAEKDAENLTLGADLAVSGPYEPQDLPAPRAPRPRPTATRSSWAAPCARARRAN